jgi:hypothetical protein
MTVSYRGEAVMTVTLGVSVCEIDSTYAPQVALRISLLTIERASATGSGGDSQPLRSSNPPPTTHITPAYLPSARKQQRRGSTFLILLEMIKLKKLLRNQLPHINIRSHLNLQMVQFRVPPSARTPNNWNFLFLLFMRRLGSTPIAFPFGLLFCLGHCYISLFLQMGRGNLLLRTPRVCLVSMVWFVYVDDGNRSLDGGLLARGE